MSVTKELTLETIELLWDNVLVEPIIQEQDGRIHNPQQYEDKPEQGKVIAVGQGRMLDSGTLIKSKVKIGDTILFNRYSASKEKIGGKDYLFIREEDILARS